MDIKKFDEAYNNLKNSIEETIELNQYCENNKENEISKKLLDNIHMQNLMNITIFEYEFKQVMEYLISLIKTK